MLYDLHTDCGEKTDLSQQYPEIVSRLEKLAAELRTRNRKGL